jgi:hypothetical protein
MRRAYRSKIQFPVALPGLRQMTDEELVRFGKEVRRLAENPFQRQLEEARREWKQRKNCRIREQK